MAEPEFRCLYCKDQPLAERSNILPRHSAFVCPRCSREYDRGEGDSVHEAWGNSAPWTLPLYSLIFADDPKPRIAQMVDFLTRDKTPEELEEIARGIDEEIVHPKQRVSEILDPECDLSEKAVRNYLQGVSIGIWEFLEKKTAQ